MVLIYFFSCVIVLLLALLWISGAFSRTHSDAIEAERAERRSHYKHFVLTVDGTEHAFTALTEHHAWMAVEVFVVGKPVPDGGHVYSLKEIK